MLENRIICVTGASSGIGQAVALRLAKAGATVILTGKSPSKLGITADQITSLGYTEAIIAPLDLLTVQESDIIDFAMSVGERWGRLDGLIHCAGILGMLSPVVHFSDKIWKEVFQVMVHAPFLLTKTCLPLLKQSSSPRLLFTVNQEAIGKAYWGAYGAAQNAILSLAESIREEHENVKTFSTYAIDPIKARTPLRAKAFPGESPTILPSPSHIAECYYQSFIGNPAHWIITPESSNILKIST